MKVGIVNKFFFPKGGQENVMLEEARLLEQKGLEVAFFSMHHALNPSPYKYSRYFVDNVDFSNLGKGYSLAEKLRIARNFVHNKKAAYNFEKFLIDFMPDVIHCHGIAHQITPSILQVARRYKVPVVQTLHDYQIICPCYTLLRSGRTVCENQICANGNYWKCILHKCTKESYIASILNAIDMYHNYFRGKYLKYTDKFISPSKFLRERVIRSGVPMDKIIHIPNFQNIENRKPAYLNKSFFLYAGRLSYEKGLYTLLSAFKQLPQAKLVVAGTGPLEAKLKQYCFDKNISNLDFVGFRGGEELGIYFRNCVAMILPSEWYENAPMSIIEAFSFGKPVISSDLGGNPEMVREGFNGYLFPAGSSEELKNRIENFLKDKGLSERLGRNARDFALKNYGSEKHIKSLIGLYRSVLKTKEGAQMKNSLQE